MSDDADERERAEAESLARALDPSLPAAREGASADPPSEEGHLDALETAALLRYGSAEGALRQDRAEAVLARLMPELDAPNAARGRLVRLFPITAGALAVAAAAWLMLSTGQNLSAPANDDRSASSGGRMKPAAPASPTAGTASGSFTLPAPPQRLLATQATLADDEATRDPVAFETEMRAYREQVLRALERAYPARLGVLMPRGRR